MNDIDLFLSYNSADHGAVEKVRQLLEARGISTFLDRRNLVPGVPWPQELEKALKRVRAVAVFLGDRIGPWQQREINYALERQGLEESSAGVFPVVPVLLKRTESLSLGFLSQNTWVDLSAGTEDGPAIDGLVRAVRATVAEPRQSEPLREVCPFLGLKSFLEEDSPLFFGREDTALRLLEVVSSHRVVTLIGSSGSGKSSLIQAGLLPLLRRQRPPQEIWEAISLNPGRRPFRSLAGALVPFLHDDLRGPGLQDAAMTLAKLFLRDSEEVQVSLSQCLESLRRPDRILVVVDQLEELFTQAEQEDGERFLLSLLHAQEDLPLTLLFTLRADFYDRVTGLIGDLGKRILSDQETLYAMTREDLSKAIQEPARRARLEFEPGLVEQILDDAGQEPGNLPLVEFALRSLWRERDDGKLTHQGYRKIGKVAGAIADAADRVFLQFPEGEQTHIRRVFTRVVRIDPPEEGGRRFRQRISLDELNDEEKKIASRLAAEEGRRLLVLGREGMEDSVTLAHEALILHWQRLRGWLDDDQELLLWRQRLRESMKQWEAAGHTEDALLPRNLLGPAEAWLKKRPEDLAEEERRFVKASIAHRKQLQDDEARKRKRRVRAWQASTFLAVLSLVLISIAWWKAIQQERSAAARYLAAQSVGLQSVRQQTAVLLALEALRLTRKAGQPRFPPIEQALRQALLPFGGRVLGSYRGTYKRIVASPDRTRVAALGEDGKVRVWNLNAADPSAKGRVLPGVKGELSYFEVSPANRWLLIGEKAKSTLRLEGLEPGSQPRQISLLPRLARLEISADDRWLALQTGSESVQLLDLAATGIREQSLNFESPILSLAFGGEGNKLGIGLADRTVRIRSLTGKAGVITSPQSREPLRALCFVPGTNTIVGQDLSGYFWRWDLSARDALPAWELLRGLRSQYLDSRDLRIGDDGKWLFAWNARFGSLGLLSLSSRSGISGAGISGVTSVASLGPMVSYSQANTTTLFDLDKEGFRGDLGTSHPFERRAGAVRKIEIRDSFLISGGEDRLAHLWSLQQGQASFDAALGGHDDSVEVLGIGASQPWLLTSGSQGRPPRIWSLKEDPSTPGEPLRMIRGNLGGDEVVNPFLGIQAKRLLVLGTKGLGFSSLANGGIGWTGLPGTPPYIRGDRIGAFSGDGCWLAIPDSRGRIVIWNVEALTPRITLDLRPAEAFFAKLDVTGSWLAALVGSSPHPRSLALAIWRLGKKGASKVASIGDQELTRILEFSPDGQWLISAEMGGAPKLWSLRLPKLPEPRKLNPEGGGITAASFSRGWLAVAGNDQEIRLWRTSKESWSNLTPDQRLEGAAERILSLGLGSKSWVAAGGAEGTIYLWDRERSFRTPIVLKKHRAPVQSIAFSRDGRWLVSSDTHGEVFRWRMREKDLEAFACQTVGRNLTRQEWSDFLPGQKYRRTCSDLPEGD